MYVFRYYEQILAMINDDTDDDDADDDDDVDDDEADDDIDDDNVIKWDLYNFFVILIYAIGCIILIQLLITGQVCLL